MGHVLLFSRKYQAGVPGRIGTEKNKAAKRYLKWVKGEIDELTGIFLSETGLHKMELTKQLRSSPDEVSLEFSRGHLFHVEKPCSSRSRIRPMTNSTGEDQLEIF